MTLDRFLSAYHFRTHCRIVIQASPDRVFQILKSVSMRDLPLAKVLFADLDAPLLSSLSRSRVMPRP